MLTPVTLNEKRDEYTRFDKYKAKYMGRYNSVDQAKTDMSYADFGALVVAHPSSKGYDGLITLGLCICLQGIHVLSLSKYNMTPQIRYLVEKNIYTYIHKL